MPSTSKWGCSLLCVGWTHSSTLLWLLFWKTCFAEAADVICLSLLFYYNVMRYVFCSGANVCNRKKRYRWRDNEKESLKNVGVESGGILDQKLGQRQKRKDYYLWTLWFLCIPLLLFIFGSQILFGLQFFAQILNRHGFVFGFFTMFE